MKKHLLFSLTLLISLNALALDFASVKSFKDKSFFGKIIEIKKNNPNITDKKIQLGDECIVIFGELDKNYLGESIDVLFGAADYQASGTVYDTAPNSIDGYSLERICISTFSDKMLTCADVTLDARLILKSAKVSKVIFTLEQRAPFDYTKDLSVVTKVHFTCGDFL